MKKNVWVVLGSILAGLVLGLAIRRARVHSPEPEVRGLPSREAVGAALLRAEIRDLDLRLGAAREEGERIEREKTRLAVPPAPLSFEDELRRDLRTMMERDGVITRKPVVDWIRQDPRNATTLMKLAAGVVREKPRSREELERIGEFVLGYLHRSRYEDGGVERDRVAPFLVESQGSESDVLVRGWMLRTLEAWKIALPADARSALANSLKETADRDLRDALLGHLMNDPEARDLVAETIRRIPDPRDRSTQLLKAWDHRALPPAELRTQVKEIMTSDRPEGMIEQAQNWVPKYINPLAPQETIGLFHGTLSKPIDPTYKAVSLMVMGSVASIFPGHPGRAEIARYADSTDDARLKEFARKVAGLIDAGQGFAEIRKLNPLEHGFEPVKK